MPAKLDPKVAEKVMLKAELKPLEPYKNVRTKWKCECLKCGKIVSPILATIRKGIGGCGYCAAVRVDGLDALDVMIKANLKPLEPYTGTKVKWKCECLKCGKIVYPHYGSIKQGQGGCKYCANTYVNPRSAATLMLKAGLKPLEPYKNNRNKWKCECLKCGKIVFPRYDQIRKGGKGCRSCGRKTTAVKLKLSTISTSEVMLKANLQPMEPYENSHTPWKSKCLQCSKIVFPQYGTIRDGGKCEYCAGTKVDIDDVMQKMKSVNLEPLEPYKTALVKWKCKCMGCGRTVYPKYNKIQQGQGGCIWCVGLKIDPNDAVKLMIKSSLQPLEPYKNALSKWKCECLKCGKIVHPKYASIQQGGGGCKFCAISGFNYKDAAYLYLIRNDAYDALKIGIGSRKDRILDHTELGWAVVKKWDFQVGLDASRTEELVLSHIRNELKLKHFLSKEEMPQKGHTETYSLDDISVTYVRNLVDKLIKKGLQE